MPARGPTRKAPSSLRQRPEDDPLLRDVAASLLPRGRVSIALRVYLHAGLDLTAANAFWSELTAIPVMQFGKPYRAVPDSSIRSNKHPLGCPSVIYSCSRTAAGPIGQSSGSQRTGRRLAILTKLHSGVAQSGRARGC